MKKKEASQDSLIEAWMRYFLKTHPSCVIEAKHTRGADSVAYKAMEEHQPVFLRAAQDEVVVWKIDDVGYRQKPFDFIGVAGAYSFVAVRFDRFIAIISLNVWEEEQKRGERKSLTSARAREIAFDIIEAR